MATQTKQTKQRSGLESLRRNATMARLLDALDRGEDVGHYGRLVFAMVARHFLDEDELVGWLRKDRDCSEEQARSLYLQVQGRDYSPPTREKILEWQRQQDFQIILNPGDPDQGNVYKDLQFPDGVYDHIADYYEDKAEAQEAQES